MLKQVFTELTKNYSDKEITVKLWNEIIINYNDAGRYYHTLDHIETIYNELLEVKDQIEDWDVVLFALFYHDIIFNIKRTDSEVESANLAGKRLGQTHLSGERIIRCELHILATKGHVSSTDKDCNLFTDADLSVLGQPSDIYKSYSNKIRKEYFIYPDDSYKKGRSKILNHFLDLDRIYKSDYFFNKYEKQARLNLTEEIKSYK